MEMSKKKNQKEMLENKNTIRKMKNVLDELISRLDRAEKRTSAFEDNGGYLSLYIDKNPQNIQHKGQTIINTMVFSE